MADIPEEQLELDKREEALAIKDELKSFKPTPDDPLPPSRVDIFPTPETAIPQDFPIFEEKVLSTTWIMKVGEKPKTIEQAKETIVKYPDEMQMEAWRKAVMDATLKDKVAPISPWKLSPVKATKGAVFLKADPQFLNNNKKKKTRKLPSKQPNKVNSVRL